ncbi:MauE/DoxX family redox-associated membrane protein [Streptomyces sp. NPDC089424]|uniref:MauE/DoxX family redox-associated membrane protein n=1 Tax=Streptomyces sp. NPDC089424 TaxID=3365917 RepID=UPI00382D9CC7
MTSFWGGLTAMIVTLTLLVGAGSHAAGPGALGEALRVHGVLGARLRRAASVALPLAEGVLGAAGAAALLGGQVRALQAVLAASTALFGLYAGYTRHVLALGRGGPCGCSRRDVPLSRWVTRRAAALACLATAGAVLAGAGPLRVSAAELVTLLLAALACTVLLWTLPAAMHEPAAQGRAATTTHPAAMTAAHRPDRPTAQGPTTPPARRPGTTTAHGPTTTTAPRTVAQRPTAATSHGLDMITPHGTAPDAAPRTDTGSAHPPAEATVHRTAEGVSTRWTSPPAR